MKVTVNNNQVSKERPFPKLMKDPSTNAVLLMKSKSAGTILVEGSSLFNTAEVSTVLDMQRFVDFEGSVTLSNDWLLMMSVEGESGGLSPHPPLSSN